METKETVNRRVGRNLRQIRELRGMRQKDLATRLGVSYQQVQKYESGRGSCSALRLMQLSECLGVDYADLLGESLPDPSTRHLRQSQALIRNFHRLPPKLQETIFALVRALAKND